MRSERAASIAGAVASVCNLVPLALRATSRCTARSELARPWASSRSSRARRFANNALSETLRSNVRGSMRNLAIAQSAPGYWRPWEFLTKAIEAGESTASEALGGDLWDWYRGHPEESAAFTGATDNLAAQVAAEVTRAIENDEQCTVLLRNCAESLPCGGRVLVVEMVVSEDGRPCGAHLTDINMLVLLPDRERTVTEYGQLFTAAGLKLERVHPTQSSFSILKAVKA